LPLFVQLMGKNVRNNFLEPRASTGETGRRELLLPRRKRAPRSDGVFCKKRSWR
jgi:hypothetical protein